MEGMKVTMETTRLANRHSPRSEITMFYTPHTTRDKTISTSSLSEFKPHLLNILSVLLAGESA